MFNARAFQQSARHGRYCSDLDDQFIVLLLNRALKLMKGMRADTAELCQISFRSPTDQVE